MSERENTGAKPSLQDDRDAALLGNFGPLSESRSHRCTQPQLTRFFFFFFMTLIHSQRGSYLSCSHSVNRLIQMKHRRSLNDLNVSNGLLHISGNIASWFVTVYFQQPDLTKIALFTVILNIWKCFNTHFLHRWYRNCSALIVSPASSLTHTAFHLLCTHLICSQ